MLDRSLKQGKKKWCEHILSPSTSQGKILGGSLQTEVSTTVSPGKIAEIVHFHAVAGSVSVAANPDGVGSITVPTTGNHLGITQIPLGNFQP